MEQITSRLLSWVDYLRGHPLLAAAVLVVLIGFYVASTWKPKHARDAESRLRQIREETHDYYRHQRPPGR